MLRVEDLPLHCEPDVVEDLVAAVVEEHANDREGHHVLAELHHYLVDWRHFVEMPEYVDRDALLASLLPSGRNSKHISISRRRLIAVAFLSGGEDAATRTTDHWRVLVRVLVVSMLLFLHYRTRLIAVHHWRDWRANLARRSLLLFSTILMAFYRNQRYLGLCSTWSTGDHKVTDLWRRRLRLRIRLLVDEAARFACASHHYLRGQAVLVIQKIAVWRLRHILYYKKPNLYLQSFLLNN